MDERRPRVEHVPDRGQPDLPPSREQIYAVERAARRADPGPDAVRDLALAVSDCLRDLKDADGKICDELRAHGERIIHLERQLVPLASANATIAGVRSFVAWLLSTVGGVMAMVAALNALGWL